MFEFIDLLPNRNEQAIYIKANKLGLKGAMGRFLIKDEDIIDMYVNKKMSCAEISRKLDISNSMVSNRLKKNNIQVIPVILKGDKAPNWKGGITSSNKKARSSREFKEWRKQVFERDCYACQCCGDNKGGNLHAHHIENFSEHENKRFDIDNGITLCDKCHDFKYYNSFHYIYGTRKNNKEQLTKYIHDYHFDCFMSL